MHLCMHEYVCVDMRMCLHVHLIIWLKSRMEGRERETKACVQHMWCSLDILGGKERNE